ncbi:hypothetical protein ACFSTE_16380 [Aquimarina hainanensis]|uniref:DUF3052 domain-containing protein n=1 Tax=Aquimarina hainanensis TaxID=1578017 RepID=A0ABW5NE12_9FLAO|nr:hypothetical protein [Aquimarina sp. TRL1]QKX07070.1 hypothetical protein HN014_19845 [Aquimarina sp. TRL1]
MTTPLFQKLQLPKNFDEILILNEPEGFNQELEKLQNITIKESLIQVSEVDFALVFVTHKQQIENRIETIYPKLVGDAILWFAYPKKYSTKGPYQVSKETGWGVLGDYNLRPVDHLSINNTWMGMRFRKVGFMKQNNIVRTH